MDAIFVVRVLRDVADRGWDGAPPGRVRLPEMDHGNFGQVPQGIYWCWHRCDTRRVVVTRER